MKYADYLIQFEREGPYEFWRNYYDKEVQAYVVSFL